MVTKLWRIAKYPILFTALIIIIPLIYVKTGCDDKILRAEKEIKPEYPSEVKKILDEIPDYKRGEETTYLTIPEWYIVYSAQEYASFIEKNEPSRFPYFSSIGQYWKTYCQVYSLTEDRYPLNTGYHVLLFVIGESFSIENGIKGLYENTVGRISESLMSYDIKIQEDAYAQKVAREYADFLPMVPWYEFPFGSKLTGLWKETDLWGSSPLRKWERKIVLSLEYFSKAIYGGIIKKATKSAYSPAELEIMVWMQNIPQSILKNEPKISIVEKIDSKSEVVKMPSYKLFTDIMLMLSRSKLAFYEIAGNDEINVTAIAPSEWEYKLQEGEFLFDMKILSDPLHKKIVVRAPVKDLSPIINGLEESGASIEHIYDYQ